jgi:cytosine/adenosine deaminase-related metal-dependent hydrolase
MILNNVKIAGTDQPVNIRIDKNMIAQVSPLAFTTEPIQLTFDNAIIFSGLINSHDHLDFNLFPQLGNRIYSNYTEWGKHLHETYKSEIAAILKIPLLLRAQWGIYKNLLCGVTTVVNHGERLGLGNDLITVFEACQNLHSVHFEKQWRLKLNSPFKLNLPAVIHVGEGIDDFSFREIDELTRWNLFNKKLIGIHAVTMCERQAKKFKAIIWCPQSNYFLLNKTAPMNILKKNTTVLFGTDSTLTGNWDIWQHLKLARETKMLDDKSLYYTLNHNAAAIWQLNCGAIAPGKDADLVVAKTQHGKTGFDAFFGIEPADLLLVIHKGNIRMFDETLLSQLKACKVDDFSKIYINGACKYVPGDLPGLIESIKQYNPAVHFPVSTGKPD